MMATVSARLTVRLAPRRTRTSSGPMRYSFSRSSATTRGSSLIAEHIHRGEGRRTARGRDGGEEGDHQGGADDEGEVAAGQLHGKVVDLVDVAREPDDLVGVLQPDDGEAEGAPGHGAHEPDQHAGGEEDGPDGARGGAHRLEDADLLPLLGHEQDEEADDGEPRHQ